MAIIAVVLACLGLIGLSAAATDRRTKEIGIRKAMGAGEREIVWLLVRQFTKPVIWAAVDRMAGQRLPDEPVARRLCVPRGADADTVRQRNGPRVGARVGYRRRAQFLCCTHQAGHRASLRVNAE